MYTDLRKQDLGSRLQFTSQIGGGSRVRDSDPAWRSVSRRASGTCRTPGMASSNPGINTIYGLVGLTFR